jgi:hypothetical protein
LSRRLLALFRVTAAWALGQDLGPCLHACERCLPASRPE